VLKITKVAEDDLVQSWKLEGKLREPWLEELAAVCAHPSPRERTLVLDLSAVSYVDAAGARLLQGLRAEGVTLSGCSQFIGELLDKVKR
jgi:anti-anti-sigma regulatory factor